MLIGNSRIRLNAEMVQSIHPRGVGPFCISVSVV